MTVVEKTKIYTTKDGRRRSYQYVAFQRNNSGNVKETYCGKATETNSWVKAYNLEVHHLQTRFEYYLNALMDAKDKLAAFEEDLVDFSQIPSEKKYDDLVEHACPICFSHIQIPRNQLVVFCPCCDVQSTNSIALEEST